MKKRIPVLAIMALCGGGAVGCGEDAVDAPDSGPQPGDTGSGHVDGDTENDTGGMVASCADVVSDGTMAITDDTNYAFSSTLSVEMTTLKDATDLVFDWSGITQDFFGKPVNPILDIDLVLLSLWHMTPVELIANMNRDNLPQDSMIAVITSYPQDNFTSRNLLGFDVLGNPLPEADLWKVFDTSNPDFEYPQTEYTFMAMAGTGTVAGKGARMIHFFNIDPNATETTLRFTDTSTTMDYTVDLKHAMPVPVPAGMPGLAIDWSAMTTNALGNSYDVFQITEAVVAHYPNYNLSQVEDRFLYLEEDAGGWWSAEVASGVSIDLSTLVDAGGSAFPGVDDTGVWLVALFCTVNCNNPAPWSITILQPC